MRHVSVRWCSVREVFQSVAAISLRKCKSINLLPSWRYDVFAQLGDCPYIPSHSLNCSLREH